MTRRRSSARAIYVFSGAVLALSVLFSACAETRRGLGEDCIKDEDCLTGICSSMKCAAAPPIGIVSPADAATDATMTSDGSDGASEGGGNDGGTDAPAAADAVDGPQRDANTRD